MHELTLPDRVAEARIGRDPLRLAELADDPNPTVRAWVVENTRTDDATLHRLATDADPLVADGARLVIASRAAGKH